MIDERSSFVFILVLVCNVQIFYALGAVGGGYASAAFSSTLGATVGSTIPQSFIGGFLLYLGARIGGGCTR